MGGANKDAFEDRLFLSMPQWLAVGVFAIVEILLLLFSLVSGLVSTAAVVGASITIVAAALLVVALLRSGANYIAEKDNEVADRSEWKRVLQLRVKAASACEDDKEKEAVDELVEAIRLADSVSSNETLEIEQQIGDLSEQLSLERLEERRCKRLIKLISERNEACKSRK